MFKFAFGYSVVKLFNIKPMFNKDKKKDSPKSISSTNVVSNGLNSIVKGTSIEGTLKASSDIRVDGTIKGHLICESKVIIGPDGKITGDVTCQNAVIEGTFEGNLTVKELLNIRETGNVSGDITTGNIIIQNGGKFNVTSCNMGGNNFSNSKKNQDAVKGKPANS